MLMIDVFKKIIIMPIEIIFDAIFCYFQNEPGLAIIIISIVMNFLTLPLYQRADVIQEEERNKIQSMKAVVDHINSTFKGDERYMMLSAYYKTQNYKPIYSLKSLFPLLLEIPFFIAAYNYLSTQQLLNGASFLFLNNLGKPDGLLKINSISINVMPILMTVINICSAYIYLKGASLKDKIQTYGIAIVFLVLLYNSPSGLVLYWTLNQVFSVIKNVFMKIVKNKDIRNKIFMLSGFAIIILLVICGKINTLLRAGFAMLFVIICSMPLIISKYKDKIKGKIITIKQINTCYYILGVVLLTIFMGTLIPLAVIESDPTEFNTLISTPLSLVFNNTCIFAGFFIVWLGIYYCLSTRFVRNVFAIVVWVISGVFLVNYLFFAGHYGTMSSDYIFDVTPIFNREGILINTVVLLIVVLVLFFIFYKWKKIVPYAYIVLIISCIGLSCYYSIGIAKATKAPSINQISANDKRVDSLNLSKNGKNVIVFVVDKAMGGYVPFIFDEKPELKQQYSGFTFYPNTLSYGVVTNWGAPGLYGGHEYSPKEINKRENELLVDKHDESLSVMPAIFSNNGFNVTVWGTVLAGYGDVDKANSLYDFDSNIKRFEIDDKYQKEYIEKYGSSLKSDKLTNSIWYCIFRVSPLLFRGEIYNDGKYLKTTNIIYDESFLSNYSSLSALCDITNIVDVSTNSFLMLYNSLPHQPAPLLAPDYSPYFNGNVNFDNIEKYSKTLNNKTINFDTKTKTNTYASNMATFIQIGKWLDYLKKEGVYDNTRIIIASDHGAVVGQIDGTTLNDSTDIEAFNCLLMIKDFNSSGELESLDNFMMNADVPYLTTKDIVKNPTNPFTDKKIINSNEISDIELYYYRKFKLSLEEKQFNLLSGNIYSFKKGDIYDKNNWIKIK